MKPYFVSLAVGSLVGVIYALFNVRSPAPPVIALVGLLGILLGEQIPSLFKQPPKADRPAARLQEQVPTQALGPSPTCKNIGEDRHA